MKTSFLRKPRRDISAKYLNFRRKFGEDFLQENRALRMVRTTWGCKNSEYLQPIEKYMEKPLF